MLFSPPMLLSSKAPMAASFVTNGMTPSGSNPYTFSGVSIGDAAGDRLVVVAIGWGTSGTVTVSSATIGGVSASIAAQTTGTNVGIALIYAVVPSGTTADIVVTMSTSGSRLYYGVWRVTGQLSTTPYDTDAPAGGGSASRSVTIDIPAGGFVFAASQGSDPGGVTWTNATERWDYSDFNDKNNGADTTSATLVTNQNISVSSARAICAAAWQ